MLYAPDRVDAAPFDTLEFGREDHDRLVVVMVTMTAITARSLNTRVPLRAAQLDCAPGTTR